MGDKEQTCPIFFKERCFFSETVVAYASFGSYFTQVWYIFNKGLPNYSSLFQACSKHGLSIVEAYCTRFNPA